MLDDNQSKIDASVMLLGSHTWQAVIQDARTFVGSRKIDYQPSLASGQALPQSICIIVCAYAHLPYYQE